MEREKKLVLIVSALLPIILMLILTFFLVLYRYPVYVIYCSTIIPNPATPPSCVTSASPIFLVFESFLGALSIMALVLGLILNSALFRPRSVKGNRDLFRAIRTLGLGLLVFGAVGILVVAVLSELWLGLVYNWLSIPIIFR